MNFGWKVLIPFGLLWVLATGAIIVLPERVRARSARRRSSRVGLIVARLAARLAGQAAARPRQEEVAA